MIDQGNAAKAERIARRGPGASAPAPGSSSEKNDRPGRLSRVIRSPAHIHVRVAAALEGARSQRRRPACLAAAVTRSLLWSAAPPALQANSVPTMRATPPEKVPLSVDLLVRTDLLPRISSESSHGQGFSKLPWLLRRLILFRVCSRSWRSATDVPVKRASASAGDLVQAGAPHRRDGAGVLGGQLPRTPAPEKVKPRVDWLVQIGPLLITTRESPLLSWVRVCVGRLTWLGAATRPFFGGSCPSLCPAGGVPARSERVKAERTHVFGRPPLDSAAFDVRHTWPRFRPT